MKKKYNIFFAIALVMLGAFGCSEDFPIDEDGLLITGRGECFVANFELLGSELLTVRSKAPVIDTVAQRIDVEVAFGTNLTYLWPQFTLANDAKLEPKITGRVDFSDLANPRKWTVISGNRKVRKEYTVYVTVQNP